MINAVEVAVKWEYRNETSISIFFEGKAKIFFAEMEYPDGHFVYSENMSIVGRVTKPRNSTFCQNAFFTMGNYRHEAHILSKHRSPRPI